MNELHFGLCVGIDRYPGFPGRDLSSASGDARSFRDWLVAPAGGALPAGNVSLVTIEATVPFKGVEDARPKTLEVILALGAINERIRRHLETSPQDWPKTRVYLYAAGHGVAIPNGEGGILMADANPSLLDLNVDLSLYADWYLHCGLVREVIVLVDCCREVVAGAEPGVVLFKMCPDPAYKGTVRLIGYSSRYGEAAYEPQPAVPIDATAAADPNLGRGYFTQALIDGLNGAAADAKTRQVTAASLATYVAQAVEAKTRPPVAPYPQHVEMPVDMGAPLILVDAPAAGEAAVPGARGAPADGVGGMHTATIRFPQGYAGEVSVRTGDGISHGRWRASDGDWPITLADSYYRVVPDPPDATKFQGDGLFALVGADTDVRL
jgi:hypothetical protein